MLPIGANDKKDIIKYPEIIVLLLLFIGVIFIAFLVNKDIAIKIGNDKKNSNISLIYIKKILEKKELTVSQSLTLSDVYMRLKNYSSADSILNEIMKSKNMIYKRNAYIKHLQMLINYQIPDSKNFLLKKSIDSVIFYCDSLEVLKKMGKIIINRGIYPYNIKFIDKIISLSNDDKIIKSYLLKEYKIFMSNSAYNKAFNTISAIYKIDGNLKTYYKNLIDFYIMNQNYNLAIDIQRRILKKFPYNKARDTKKMIYLFVLNSDFKGAEIFIEHNYSYFKNKFKYIYNVIIQSGKISINERFLNFVLNNDNNIDKKKYSLLLKLSLANNDYNNSFFILTKLLLLDKKESKYVSKLIDLSIWKHKMLNLQILDDYYKGSKDHITKKKIIAYLIRNEKYNFVKKLILYDINNGDYRNIETLKYVYSILGEPEKSFDLYMRLYKSTGNVDYLVSGTILSYQLGDIEQSYKNLQKINKMHKLDMKTALLFSNLLYLKKESIKTIYNVLKSVKVDENDSIKFVYYQNLNNLAWLSRDKNMAFKISKYLVENNRYNADNIEVLGSIYAGTENFKKAATIYKIGWDKFKVPYFFINYFDYSLKTGSPAEEVLKNSSVNEIKLLQKYDYYYSIMLRLALKNRDRKKIILEYKKGISKFPQSSLLRTSFIYGLIELNEKDLLKKTVYDYLKSGSKIDNLTIASAFNSLGYVDKAMFFLLKDGLDNSVDEMSLYSNIRENQTGVKYDKFKEMAYKIVLKNHKKSYQKLRLLELSFNKKSADEILSQFRKTKLSAIDSINFLISFYSRYNSKTILHSVYNENRKLKYLSRYLDISEDRYKKIVYDNSDKDLVDDYLKDYIVSKSKNVVLKKNSSFEKIEKNSRNISLNRNHAYIFAQYEDNFNIINKIYVLPDYYFNKCVLSKKTLIRPNIFLSYQLVNYIDNYKKSYSFGLSIYQKNFKRNSSVDVALKDNKISIFSSYSYKIKKVNVLASLGYHNENMNFYNFYMNGYENSLHFNLGYNGMLFNSNLSLDYKKNYFKSEFMGNMSRVKVGLSKNIGFLPNDNFSLKASYNLYSQWDNNSVNLGNYGVLYKPQDYYILGCLYSISPLAYNKYLYPYFSISTSIDDKFQSYDDFYIGLKGTVLGADQLDGGISLEINPQINNSLQYMINFNYKLFF